MIPIMACGHAANGTDMKSGLPVCVICGIGGNSDNRRISVVQPDLSKRQARCHYHGSDVAGKCPKRKNYSCGCNPDTGTLPSDAGLPFFKHIPFEEEDEFYCGCWGWD